MEVRLTNIRKYFGPVKANDGISLTVPAGTIQGILGENGAGKSTLMKILSGFQPADSGAIELDGKAVRMRSPADAIRHGVGMLHQDPLDFPPLSVVDDLLVGAPGRIFPRKAEAIAGVSELAESLGLSVDFRAEVGSMTVGERQQLELIRLLWLGARVLILDEPTTGISAAQRQQLFDTLRRLAEQGMTVLFVSHKLEEVQELCTRVAVLRQGRLVGEALPPFHVDGLVSMMFEREVSPGDRHACSPGRPVLRLSGLGAEHGRIRFEGLDLEVCAGETIGLAGMEGSGQSLLLEACAGLAPPIGGRIHLDDADLTGKAYRYFKRRGVAYVPATRLEDGLVPGLTLTEHFLLTEKQPGFFIKRERGRHIAQERIAEFNIKGTPGNRVESLSGGNQQRALLALVKPGARLMLLEHPTRGLDVESVIYLWNKLKERCKQGETIIFTSSDLDELLRYSDRLLVFFSGQVFGPLEAATTTVDELGQLIGGSTSGQDYVAAGQPGFVGSAGAADV
ncbi:MAG: ATP-binding cassette domain-containing protein [Thermoleophilia bacterium]|nr:ATP-binding cassette domain-containing protein [Thermoleophilia bacterium]